MIKLLTLIAVMLLGFLIIACEPGGDSQVFQYDVVFDLDGGALNIETQTIWENRTATKPNNPLKEGYQFLYWANAETLEEWNFVNNKVNEDLTLVAVWGKTHRVIFDKSYGEDSVIEDFLILTESKLDEGLPLKREGYTFVNWTVNGEYFDFENEVVIEDLLIVATWEVKFFTISFNSNGGSLVDPVTQDFGTDLEKPIDPVLEGHHLVGWFIDIDLEEEYIFDHIEDVDLTLYAKWEINEYTITFDSNEGEEVSDLVLTFGVEIELPTPIRHAWIFIEWQLDGIAFDFDTPIISDLTLVAIWEEESTEPVEEIIILQSDFGKTNGWGHYNLISNQAIENGSNDSNPNGSSFWKILGGNVNNSGWDYIRMGGKVASSVTDPQAYLATNFTFTEKVTKIIIEIKALDSATGDEKIHLQESSDGINWTTITSQITKIGDLEFNNLNIETNKYIRFVFERASTSSNYGTHIKNITFFTTISSQTTSEEDEYIISFNTDGGSTIEDIIVKDGNKAIAPTEPTKAGFKFIGWFIDDEEFDFDTPITSDLTLTAKWEEDETAPVTNETYLETFDNITISGSQYTNGSFSGVNNQLWNHTESRGDMSLDGKALLLRVGSLTTTFTEGLSAISFDYQRAFTCTSARSFEVYINGALIETITVVSNSDTRGTFTLNNLNYTGEVQLEIKKLGAQKLIDNLSWTTNK